MPDPGSDTQLSLSFGPPRAAILTASAGSGKTSVLVRHYLSLLKSGARPDEILTLTFTHEAALEMRSRITDQIKHSERLGAKLLDEVGKTPNIGTIHSFCYRSLNKFGSVLGLLPIDDILTPYSLASEFDRQYQKWQEQLPLDSLSSLLRSWSATELYEASHTLFYRRHEIMSALALIDPYSPELSLLKFLVESLRPLFLSLENQFRGRGKYTFDDLEILTLQILKESPTVTSLLQEQFSFVLVDEFQDTSDTQWEIIQRLVENNSQRLFAVGDPKQSIYRFRFANPDLILKVKRDFGSAVEEDLITNYRSSPRLLDTVNTITQFLFKESEIPFEPMRAGRTADESMPDPFMVKYFEKNERYLWHAERKAVLASTRAYFKAGGEAHDLALLFRVSDRMADYAEALSQLGIRVVCQSSRHLFNSYDILDIVNFLKCVYDPHDELALNAFLRSPYVGFDYTDLSNLSQRPGKSTFHKLTAFEDTRVRWFIRTVETGECDCRRLLEALFKNASYFPKNSHAFLAFLGGLEAEYADLGTCLQSFSSWEKNDILYNSRRHEEPGTNRMRLLTVHAAKGLEFKNVFLVDNGRITPRRHAPVLMEPHKPLGIRYRISGTPHLSQAYIDLQEEMFKKDRQESRRLLFVALTRARESLTLFLPSDPKLAPKDSWSDWLSEALKS